MSPKGRFTRREFMVAAGIVAVGSSVSCGKLIGPWRSLTADEANTLASLCGQIIPEDHDLGAVSAGVVNYIDIQLAGHFKKLKGIYRRGIAELNVRCIEKYGSAFGNLSDAQQVEFLTAIDSSKSARDSVLQKFFWIVVEHTMQGFYGDPRHGGNRDRASWAMLRLPYPPIRGRFREELKAAGTRV